MAHNISTTSIEQLSLREKIGQTAQECLSDLVHWYPDGLAPALSEYPVGSIFVGADVAGQKQGGYENMSRLIQECRAATRIPLSVAGDLENGAGTVLPTLTTFPPYLCLGATEDAELAYEYGQHCALESRALGFDWTFSPVADLAMNWLNPVVGTRCLGESTDRVLPLLTALIKGLQDHGMSATAKHFPGDGVDFRDQHLITSVNSLSQEAWWDSYGRIYKVCFDAGVHTIMAGHIALPWLDQATGKGGRPRPATVSRPILNDLLRNELGFEGLVVSDALMMAGFTGWATYEDRIIEAFNAGVDIMLWPGRNYVPLMENAIERGRISMERLDESVERILAFKTKKGLFKPQAADESQPPISQPQTLDLSVSVAAKGITLVRNHEDRLPLSPTQTKKILLILATQVQAGAEMKMATMIHQFEARGAEVTVQINGNCLDLYKREDASEHFDALLVVYQIGMHFPKNSPRPVGEVAECMWMQQNTNTLSPIIISMGTPYLLHDMPYASTMVNTYGANKSVQQELVSLLYGEIPFTGNSPVDVGGDWA